MGVVDMSYFSIINQHLTASAKIIIYLYKKDVKQKIRFKEQLEYYMPKRPISFIEYDDNGIIEQKSKFNTF